MADKPTYRLRPEAEPLSWRDLTEEQRNVIVQLHELLAEYVHFSGPPPKPLRLPDERVKSLAELLPAIVSQRHSNVFLIDGGRGTGKTSVLVTLLQLWHQLVMGTEVALLAEQLPEDTPASWAAQQDQLRKLIDGTSSSDRRRLARRLLPLGVLDLQPIPPSTSLMLWLASRLNELVRVLAEPAEPAAVNDVPWAIGAHVESDSKKAWREFLHAAALSGDGHLKERKGKLDPEAFVEELEATELHRLDVPRRWQALVQALRKDLAERYRDRLEPDVCIVVPIDDADMNAERCRELLDLVHMLWAPGLVFVLTGNSELFRTRLHIHVAKQMFGKPIGDPEQGDTRGLIRGEAEASPRGLAEAIYRKIIPPSNRLLIPLVPPAMRFAILQKKKPALSIPVARSGPDKDLAPRTLAAYFEYQPQCMEGLPSNLRALQDLKQALESAAESSAEAAFLTLWKGLTDVPEPVARAFQRGDSDPLKLSLAPLVYFEFGHARKYPDPQTGPLSFAPLSRMYIVMPDPLETPQTQRNRPVADRMAGLTLLGLSLLADAIQVDTGLPGQRVPHSFEVRFFAGFQKGPNPGMASRAVIHTITPKYDPGLGPLNVCWPLPDWPSPLDTALFHQQWELTLKWIENTDGAGVAPGDDESWYNWLAQRFVQLVTRIHRERVRAQSVTELWKDTPGVGEWQDIWQVCKMCVDELAKAPSVPARAKAYMDWVRGAAVLLGAPESGLPARVANPLVEAWFAIFQSEENKKAVLDQRRHRILLELPPLKQYSEQDPRVDPILDEIDGDKSAREHVFHGRLQGDEILSQETRDQLQKIFSDIHVDLAQESPLVWSKTANLYDYIEALAIEDDLFRGPPRWFEQLRRALEPFRNQENAAARALDGLRQLAVEIVIGRKPDLDPDSIPPLADFGEIPTEVPQTLKPILTPYQWDTRWKVRLPADMDHTRPWDLPNPLAAALTLAHDVLVDQRDDKQHEGLSSTDSRQFPPYSIAGLDVSYYGDDLHLPWPLPRWQSLSIRRLLWHSLKDAMITAGRYIQGVVHGTNLDPVIDAVLFAYLSAVLTCVRPGDRTPRVAKLNFDVQSGAWELLARQLVDADPIRKSPASYHTNAYHNWLTEECALLAAPESGLSSSAAQAFLLVLQQALSRHTDEPEKQILWRWREVREQRLHASIAAAGRLIQVKTLRGWLFRTDSSHAWYKIVESDAEPAEEPK